MKVPGLPKVDLPAGCYLASAATRPDLWEPDSDSGEEHPLDNAYPPWIDKGATCETYFESLGQLPSLAPFQLFILHKGEHGKEDMVALSNAVPFYWPNADQSSWGQEDHLRRELHSALPNGGWDSIIARGVLQAKARSPDQALDLESEPLTDDQRLDVPISNRTEAPNLLSALSIVVTPYGRSLGLAAVLIQCMKALAKDAGMKCLVVPLRPTRKSDYPNVPMAEYVRWKQSGTDHEPDKSHALDLNLAIGAETYDPWLRKHMRVGAAFVKVAPTSMVIEGSTEDWREWTGIDYGTVAEEAAQRDASQIKDGITDIRLDRALAPLHWNISEGFGRYIEPNVWVYHRLS